MSKKIKEIGGLSKKAKFNIFIGVFLVFIIISVLTSLSQVTNIIRNREKVTELEQELNYEREKNIELLAEEKAMYEEEAIELEARKQFNMTKEDETNYFVEIEEDGNSDDILSRSNDSGTDSTQADSGYKEYDAELTFDNYKDADLWGNIKILYEAEIKE